MQSPLNSSVDSIIITKKETGRLVDAELNNVVIASISNDEIILHNDYEVKVVPVDND